MFIKNKLFFNSSKFLFVFGTTQSIAFIFISQHYYIQIYQKILNMSNGSYLSSSFLYVNLGCHMMFVLKNRLKAQGIPQDKTLKIINDLVLAIFRDHFIKTLLIPQEPLSLQTLKDLFRKLAHASIMKLDNSSMEKLLYLIIMTVKKQLFQTSSPLQIYSLTIGNLKILQLHARGGDGEKLVQFNIEYFTAITGVYNFIQFMEIKQHLLTTLQNYQTKVINFNQSGHQTDQGKLVFVRRNHHNEMPLGCGTNHPQVHLSSNQPYNSVFLSLKDWRNWKTSIVVDHPEEYQKQSERRQIKADTSKFGKQTNLNQIFNIKNENITEFEVKLDFFDYGQSKVEKPKEKVSLESKQIKATGKTVSGSVEIKNKIDKEFQNLKIQKFEQQDLLDMMDG